MQIGFSSLASLAYIRDFQSRRASSYDRRGGNRDWVRVRPGGRHRLAAIEGPGCIKHLWCTGSHAGDRDAMRSTVLQMWWDGERNPSVEVPLADFFGGGFGICKDFWSLPLQMNPDQGRGMNCWFPMPFRRHARIEVHNQWHQSQNLYYYVDYEVYPDWKEDLAYFHAQWRRENPTAGWGRQDLKGPRNLRYLRKAWATANTTGAGNYVILEAWGKGQYVGCHLDVDCFQREKNDWYGEGDDMIFVDGEPWPPRLHGTGTEDYFSAAYGPRTEYSTPYCGITQYSGSQQLEPADRHWPYRGKNSLYRFHIEDPIRFERSIRVTIEHGHNNKLSNDYSSTAYWYQFEPHGAFPPLPPPRQRLARPDWPAFQPVGGVPAGPAARRRRKGG